MRLSEIAILWVPRARYLNLIRPPEGLVGVDHPVPAAGGGERGVELSGVGEMGDGAGELQLAAAMSAGDPLEGSGAEKAGEDLDGDESSAADPDQFDFRRPGR